MPVYGPNSPGTAASEAFSGSGAAWTNPSNALDADDDYALGTAGTGSPTEYLKLTSFGFTIGAGETIDGVLVEYRVTGFGTNVKDNRQRLVKGGTVEATDRSDAAAWPSAYPPTGYISRGGASDLWGGTWADTDVEAAGFGCAVSAQVVSAGGENPAVTYARVTVYTSAGSNRRRRAAIAAGG